MTPTLDRIDVSNTALGKADRYLDERQLKRALREGSGYVCTRTSPSHEDLYPEAKYVMRGKFFGQQLDIVFVVEADRVVVVTQMSQHADSLRGRFYEYVGESAADAVEDAR